MLLHWPLPQAVCWQAAAKVMVQPPATRPCPPLTLVLLLHSAAPYVDMGPLTGTWVSRTTYESDGWQHNYLYTGLSIDNSYNTDSSVTISTSNFTCKHNGTTESGLKVCSLGNFGLNSAGTGFKYVSSVTVAKGDRKTVPIYIDLGPVNTTSLNVRGVFTVELKLGGKTATFKYQPIYDDPAIE